MAIINLPQQGGNARFSTLVVNLTESSSIANKYVVADGNGKFFYSTAGGGGGGVSYVSVAVANGFSGSVINPSTSPVITLGTTVTGILKGNGTSVSAATAGTDYVIPSALSSYVLTSALASATVLSASYAITASYAMNGGGGGLSGGTTNYIPLWTGASSLSSSAMYQSASNIGINTNNPAFNLVTAGQGVAMTALNTGTSGSATIKTYASASGAINTLEVSSWAMSESGSIFFGVSGSRLNSIVSYYESKSFVIGTYSTGSLIIGTNNTARIFVSSSGNIGINTITPTEATVQINGNVSASSYTGSLFGTSSYANYASRSLSSSYATTSSYAVTASYALNGGGGSTFPYTGNAVITGSLVVSGSGLAIGTSSLGSGEFTLVLGVPPSGVAQGEGGQILLQAPMSGGYTSASMIDNYQNKLRILRGTNLGSDAYKMSIDMHSGQVQIPNYVNASSFVGTATANLAVDSSGNIITVSTSGGTVFPYVGSAVISGSLIVSNQGGYSGAITASGPIISRANGQMYFRGGDDAEFWDIDVANTVGIYGQQTSSVAGVKLGSGGPTLYGSGSNLGINTLNPYYKVDINANGSTGARIYSGSLAVGNIAPSSTVGRIDASNDVVAFSTSDQRFKSNVTPIPNAIAKVTQIGGYEFDWIQNPIYHGNKGHDVGVIAQELEKILPEVVTTRDSGYKAVKYEKIIPLLIEAIKDQQKQIEDLQRQINLVSNSK